MKPYKNDTIYPLSFYR